MIEWVARDRRWCGRRVRATGAGDGYGAGGGAVAKGLSVCLLEVGEGNES